MSSIPLWVWPLSVCLAAWIFRRSVLGAGVAEVGRPLGAASASTAIGPPGPAPRLPFALPLLPNGSAAAAAFISWCSRLRNRPADPQRITVCARKALGPHQQLFVVRVQNREYTVLSQTGATPLLLSAQTAPGEAGPAASTQPQQPFPLAGGRTATRRPMLSRAKSPGETQRRRHSMLVPRRIVAPGARRFLANGVSR